MKKDGASVNSDILVRICTALDFTVDYTELLCKRASKKVSCNAMRIRIGNQQVGIPKGERKVR